MLICLVIPLSADAGSGTVEPPMTVSLFDSQGSAVSGNLLDESDIHVSTSTDANTGHTVYSIDGRTPLMSEARYLVIGPVEAGDCVLKITAERKTGFITESGITFAFYEDDNYSVQPYCEVSFSGSLAEEKTLDRLLTAGKRYYLRAWTSETIETDDSLSSHYEIDLTFTATTGDGVNAVFYHKNDGSVDDTISSKLVVNGQKYGQFPDVSLSGYSLMGWFTDPVLGDPVHTDDIVGLTQEQHLYAHWIKQGSEEIHVDENGNDVWIWIDVTDDSVHVRIDGKSKTTRVETTYDDYVKDGKIIVDTHNPASDFSVQDAYDAKEQYSVVKETLTERGVMVDSFIIIGYGDSVSCQEGSLGILLDTDCNDIRVVGNDLTISMDREVIRSLKDLKGETVIQAVAISDESLTKEQKDKIGPNQAYGIKILNNGEEITEFPGTITVWFPYEIPEGAKNPRVYCIMSDGSVDEMPTEYKDGYIYFKTQHLSVYYVAYDTDDGSGFNWIMPVIIGSVLVVVAGAGVFVIRKKRMKGGSKE